MKNPLANRYAMKAIIFAMATFALIACGDDSGSNASDQVGKSTDDLPICSDMFKGLTAYVKDGKVAYVCKDGNWTPASDEDRDDSSSSSNKSSSSKVSSSSQKAKSSSSIDKAKSSSSGMITSSSSFKYEQDSSAYVQPKVVAVKNKSISGLSQKGPFVTGSTVKLYELDGKTFAQTGKSFTGKISSDDGKFSIPNVSLTSQYALLEVTGYFNNEITGDKSSGTITLNVLTDLSNRKNVNINLLTHLEYERVLHLIESKINFTEAKKQAETEILNAFGIKGEFANSEDLNIFGKGDDNAALLAFSVLMLSTANTKGSYRELISWELTERLTNFATDIAKDGSWDDAKTKAAIADGFAMDTLSETFENINEDNYGYSKIRQNIEKWKLGTVPNFEKYVRNFWMVIYGLGKCDSKNEGEVVATKNKYSNIYTKGIRFVCKNDSWKQASDIEKDTYQWTTGKDGEIKSGDVTKQKYDYDGKINKWRLATTEEATLGGCTETREKDFSKNTGHVNGTWYICKNREWKVTDSITVDTQTWSPGDDGELRKGDSTTAVYKYDEVLKKWLTATKNDTTLKLNGCTINRMYEVRKGPGYENYYVCDSLSYSERFGNDIKDSVIMDWRKARNNESLFGVCTEAREKDCHKNFEGEYKWYICKNGKWELTSAVTVDTQDWSDGFDSELRKGDSTNAFYKYDEAQKKWITANKRDTILKLNGCTTNREGEIGRSFKELPPGYSYLYTPDSIYYICEYVCVNDFSCTADSKRHWNWEKASEIQYNTYDEKCSKTEFGKIVDGSVNTTNKYYCTEHGWINITWGWSWEVPKELRFNPEITYGTMTDSRDNKVYKTVKIGSQIWMAENLNYADSSTTPSLKGKSSCREDKDENCSVAGRLYQWAAAIDSIALYDEGKGVDCGYGKKCKFSTKVQGICPNGWHLPDTTEWERLISKVGGESIAGKMLKSQTGWGALDQTYSEKQNGEDVYGFSALPAGALVLASGSPGKSAFFWSSSELPLGIMEDKVAKHRAYSFYMIYNSNSAFREDFSKNTNLSIRCIKD